MYPSVGRPYAPKFSTGWSNVRTRKQQEILIWVYFPRNFLKMFEQNHTGRLTELLESCGKLITRVVRSSIENVMECFTISLESRNGMMDRVIRLPGIYILLLGHQYLRSREQSVNVLGAEYTCDYLKMGIHWLYFCYSNKSCF
jgi:hypothetical protein